MYIQIHTHTYTRIPTHMTHALKRCLKKYLEFQNRKENKLEQKVYLMADRYNMCDVSVPRGINETSTSLEVGMSRIAGLVDTVYGSLFMQLLFMLFHNFIQWSLCSQFEECV